MNEPPLASDQWLIKTKNVFDDIIAGSAPVSWVYQDSLVVAFMDIQPVNPGHVLVVPKQAVQFLHQLDHETANRLFLVGRRVAQAIRDSGLQCEGVNFFVADGAAAGQEVPHVHLHVFPRYRDDGFGLKFADRYFQLPPREALDAAAEKIRAALDMASQ
ncbi:MAG: HIT family protein [Cyanobacteria bacterium P01_A01_bin.123]